MEAIMKGKVIRGSGFRGVLNYVLDQEKDAHIIGGNLLGQDAASLSKEFSHVRQIRSDCKRPVLHIPLRMPEGEDVSDERWLEIAIVFMRLMNLSPSRPWTIIKHLNNHVHLVTSRVDNRGQLWTGKWEALRCIQATQDIERLFNLTITPGLRGRNQRQTRLTSGQLRKFQREIDRGETPEVPAKVAIAERIKLVLASSDGTFEDFKRRITPLGVTVNTNTAKTTQHVSGIIFTFDGVTMKGSKVARAFGWQGLNELLTERNRQYENSRNPRPAPKFEPQPNVSRAAQPRPARADEQPDTAGIELAGTGKGVAAIQEVAAGDDGDSIVDVLMGGPSGIPIGAVAAPFVAIAKAAGIAKRKHFDDGEVDCSEEEMTIS
jgi:hypothetical protein